MPKEFRIFQEFRRRLVGIFRKLGHYFGTRNARKSIKPSKDSHDSL